MIQINTFKKIANFTIFMKRPKSRHAINNEQVLIGVFKNCLSDRYYYMRVYVSKIGNVVGRSITCSINHICGIKKAQLCMSSNATKGLSYVLSSR